jgi:hypothetical protein
MPNINFLYGIGFFILGHICAWFQLNSQFAWEWWKDKPLLAVGIYSIPVGLSFWMATRYIFEETGEAWSGRFMGFAASYFVFPILTYLLLGESMFTTKTMICIALSCCIMGVQLFWR